MIGEVVRENRFTSNTNPAAMVSSMTALGLVAVLSQYSYHGVLSINPDALKSAFSTPGTAPDLAREYSSVTPAMLLEAFQRIHDEIVENQDDLDIDARVLIFENRSILYE